MIEMSSLEPAGEEGSGSVRRPLRALPRADLRLRAAPRPRLGGSARPDLRDFPQGALGPLALSMDERAVFGLALPNRDERDRDVLPAWQGRPRIARPDDGGARAGSCRPGQSRDREARGGADAG